MKKKRNENSLVVVIDKQNVSSYKCEHTTQFPFGVFLFDIEHYKYVMMEIDNFPLILCYLNHQ